MASRRVGTQMAAELNMEAKHSIERQAAHNVDCFTTVSDVTGRECAELLDKQPDVILPNGFEADFVPTGTAFTKRRREARGWFVSFLVLCIANDTEADAFHVAQPPNAFRVLRIGLEPCFVIAVTSSCTTQLACIVVVAASANYIVCTCRRPFRVDGVRASLAGGE